MSKKKKITIEQVLEIREALKRDFNIFYQKEFTTDWKEQRFIREIEIDIMGLDNLLKFYEKY